MLLDLAVMITRSRIQKLHLLSNYPHGTVLFKGTDDSKAARLARRLARSSSGSKVKILEAAQNCENAGGR